MCFYYFDCVVHISVLIADVMKKDGKPLESVFPEKAGTTTVDLPHRDAIVEPANNVNSP